LRSPLPGESLAQQGFRRVAHDFSLGKAIPMEHEKHPNSTSRSINSINIQNGTFS